ncbi:hypothetical protein NMY22_g9136 [Coprinellus aureogranulatus]|nr:hypothetical protein NMY22_g9136 [Coprinellus aureogranulatus]
MPSPAAGSGAKPLSRTKAKETSGKAKKTAPGSAVTVPPSEVQRTEPTRRSTRVKTTQVNSSSTNTVNAPKPTTSNCARLPAEQTAQARLDTIEESPPAAANPPKALPKRPHPPTVNKHAAATPELQTPAQKTSKSPRKKTAEELEAAKRAKEEMKSRKEKLEEELGEQWTRKEEEEADQERQAPTIFCLTDLPDSESDGESDATRGADIIHSEGEEAVEPPPDSDEGKDTAEESGDSVSDDDDTILAQIKQKQAELEALKAMGKSKSKGKKKVTTATLPLASGLRSDFRVESIQKKAKNATVTVTEIGGLGDEDIDDDAPQVGGVAVSSPRRMADRRKVVSIAQAVHFPAIERPRTQQIPVIVAAPKSTTSRAPNVNQTPPLQVAFPNAPGNLRKFVKKVDRLPPPDTPIPHPGSTKPAKQARKEGSRLTTTNVRVTDLPEFVHIGNSWRSVYLPILYTLLYQSLDPFEEFALRTESLVTYCQEALSMAYPNTIWKVSMPHDPIYLISYNRTTSRRNGIAKDALVLISNHLKSFKAIDDASSWLRWARQLRRGPLFFREPVPMSCQARRGDSDYIEPGGRLRSKFVIEVLKKALQHSEHAITTSLSTKKRPIGLVGLVLASLERAVVALQPDGTVKADELNEFSDLHSGPAMRTYIKQAQALTHQQWEDIMGLCYDDYDSDTALAADRSIMDMDREELFTFESPKKRTS